MDPSTDDEGPAPEGPAPASPHRRDDVPPEEEALAPPPRPRDYDDESALLSSLDVAAAAAAVAAGRAADGPGLFEAFFTDPDKLAPEKRMPYMLMMAEDCIEGFSVKTVHPYNLFLANKKLGGGGFRRKMKISKAMLQQEIIRRNPWARTNKSNRKLKDMKRYLQPITDPRDIAFVMRKELEIRRGMLDLLEEWESGNAKPKRKRARMAKDGGDAGSSDDDADGSEWVHEGREVQGVETHKHLVESSGNLSGHSLQRIMANAEAVALAQGWKVCVAIADAQGNPLAVRRFNDASPATFDLAVGKARAAAAMDDDAPRIGDGPGGALRGALSVVVDGTRCGGVGVAGEAPARVQRVAQAGIEGLRHMTDPERVADGSLEVDTEGGLEALEDGMESMEDGVESVEEPEAMKLGL